MGKLIKTLLKTETLALDECTDGFWLYDKTRGMNLAIRAQSEQKAFIQAIEYYQKRLADVEKSYSELSKKVDAFVSQFQEDEDEK